MYGDKNERNSFFIVLVIVLLRITWFKEIHSDIPNMPFIEGMCAVTHRVIKQHILSMNTQN